MTAEIRYRTGAEETLLLRREPEIAAGVIILTAQDVDSARWGRLILPADVVQWIIIWPDEGDAAPLPLSVILGERRGSPIP